jgi:hypothetical protein
MAEDDMYTKDGTVDYRGNQADKNKTQQEMNVVKDWHTMG